MYFILNPTRLGSKSSVTGPVSKGRDVPLEHGYVASTNIWFRKLPVAKASPQSYAPSDCNLSEGDSAKALNWMCRHR